MRVIWPCYINFELKEDGTYGDGRVKHTYTVTFIRSRWKGDDLKRAYSVSHADFWGLFELARKRFGIDYDEVSLRDSKFCATIYYKRGRCIR
jgi:hypothetical protein